MVRKCNKADTESILSKLNMSNYQDILYVAQDGEDVTGIQKAADITLCGERGVYLYAPNIMRGQDSVRLAQEILQAVLSDVAAQGIKLICTGRMPQQLVGIYEAAGFTAGFDTHTVTRDIRGNLWSTADYDTITATKLKEVRHKYITYPFMDTSSTGYVNIMTRLYNSGACTALSDNGYAIYFKDKNGVYIKELYACNDADAMYIITAIANHDSRERFTMELSVASSIFSGEGARHSGGYYRYQGIGSIDFSLAYNSILEVYNAEQ